VNERRGTGTGSFINGCNRGEARKIIFRMKICSLFSFYTAYIAFKFKES
jgi:hypothetical protein